MVGEQKKLSIAFYWHMHQPDYQLSAESDFLMPWVRMHAVKDYLDMVLIMNEFPKLKLNFNLVPLLLQSLKKYGENEAHDVHSRLSISPIEDLTDDDKRFILSNFFDANFQSMISHHDDYKSLYEKRVEQNIADINAYTNQEYSDIMAWFNLAWFDPIYGEIYPELAELAEKGCNFTLEDRKKILEYQKKVVLNSKYWDVSWYLSNYRYNLNKTEALEYYIKTGWRNNESPSRYLNCEYYTNKYNIKNENPLIHYLAKGRYWCYYPDNKNNFKSKCDEKYIQDYLEYKNQRVPKGVIYTCITNDYDDINEIKTYKYVNKDWDYVCFTDNKEHIEKGQIGIWEIKPLMYNESDNTRKNRWHKFHPHILFPQYSQSIYIDANINILMKLCSLPRIFA